MWRLFFEAILNLEYIVKSCERGGDDLIKLAEIALEKSSTSEQKRFLEEQLKFL